MYNESMLSGLLVAILAGQLLACSNVPAEPESPPVGVAKQRIAEQSGLSEFRHTLARSKAAIGPTSEFRSAAGMPGM